MSGATLCLPDSTTSPQPPTAGAAWREELAGGIVWSVRGDCADDLLGTSGLRWEEWTRRAAIEVVKTGPHRTVYRLNLPGGEFYLKHFRIADWQAWLRNLVRGSPAERELRAAQRIAALRLSTFEPVALGHCRQAGVTCDSYLVSRAIPDAIPLDQFLLTEFAGRATGRQAELRERLATELGSLAARLHLAAVEHVDLHAGNLLIRPGASLDEPLLALIDLHAVAFRNSLSPARRDRNLAALHQFFAGRSTRADRRRFRLAYDEHMTSARKANRRSAVDDACRVEHILDESAHAGWRRADRAWRRGNRHVRRLNTEAIDCRGLAILDPEWLTAIRDAPEALFERHVVRWCKQTTKCRVAEVSVPLRITERAEPLRAFWKGIAERGRLASLVARWRPSRVRRAWEVGHALLRRGIDTPQPLLFVEWAGAGIRRTYLMTASVADAFTVHEFFERIWPSLADQVRCDWLARHGTRLARQVRRFHDSGFDHRDLKFPNLLVSSDLTNERVWLLDLDAVREWRRLPRMRAVQNLSRLNVSSLLVGGIRSTDRLRFLRRYLGPSFDDEWKSWWRSIAGKSSRKIARNRRAARPLS
jgi:tRNA A-37 threonylcarbamoyl transferase component Bud32